ncbi:MAG: InlB B-repeat-containing protein [Lachnospiraceae bacterium]|nr:InlB B-repeat-containing protein [Lachnospiraceae bacterium]
MKKKRIIKKTLMFFAGIAILLGYFSSSWMTMSVKAYSKVYDRGPYSTYSPENVRDLIRWDGESPDNPVYIKLYNDLEYSGCILLVGYGVVDLNNHRIYAASTNVQGPTTGVEDWWDYDSNTYQSSYIKIMGPGTIDNLDAKAVQRSSGGALWLAYYGNSTLELENVKVSGKTNGVYLVDNSKLILSGGTKIEKCGEYCIWAISNSSVTIKDAELSFEEPIGGSSHTIGGVLLENNASLIVESGTIKSENTYSSNGVFLKDNSKFIAPAGTLVNCSCSCPSDKVIVSYMPNYTGNDNIYKVAANKSGYRLDQNIIDRPGYAIKSWNTQPDGKGTSYRYDEVVSFDSETTLYAIWTDVFDINYSTNGGNFVSNYPTNYTFGTDVTLSDENVIKKDGYTFDGWYTNQNFDGTKITSISSTEYGHKYLYAKWNPNTYNVRFVTNGGMINTNNVDNYICGTGATLPDANDIYLTGNTFEGWYDNEKLNGTPFTEITATDFGDKTYYAKWSFNTYNVNLVTNEGTIKTNDVTEYTYSKGAKLPNADDVERTGYTFENWYEDASFTGNAVTFITDSEIGDKTYYANWTPHKYTVSFDSNGGTGTMTDQTRKYDDGISLPDNSFTFDGHTFAGWNTSADGAGKAYAYNATANISDGEGDTVILYAQWTTNEYVITWANEDGTVLETDTDAEYGSTPEYNGEEPTKAAANQHSYIFAGWNPEVTTVTGSATYTAKFTEVADVYTITFDANGGTVNPSSDITNVEFKLTSLPTPVYEGYEFTGWYTSAEGGTEITTDTVFTSSQTIYAHYNEIQNTEEPEEPEIPEEPEEPKKATNYLDELYARLENARILGGEQTVEWNAGDSLPYDVMKKLQENPQITLVFSYTYLDEDFEVTIHGCDVQADPNVTWCGPLYLYSIYGGYSGEENGVKESGTYIVQAGDTLSSLAEKFNTTIKNLVALNNIKDENLIYIGQELKY